MMMSTESNIENEHRLDIYRPIGVFDSGIGGLSILKALMQAMPWQPFIYMADTAYAPYGERSDDYIIERSLRIAHWLHDTQHCAGLVIACNTATAVAAKTLRETFGFEWPIIGVEPGLKPAAQISKTGRIGIMATDATLRSDKFQTLMRRVHENETIPLHLSLCACDGLAHAIEFNQTDKIEKLIKKYTQQLQKENVDVVVLGCTHYPLVKEEIMQALPGVTVLDTGEAVARQALRLFPPHSIEKTSEELNTQPNRHFQAWSNTPLLQSALKQWLPQTDVLLRQINI